MPEPPAPPAMTRKRAEVDVEDLLKLVLVLVIAWLALEVVGTVLRLTLWVFDLLPEIIGAVVVVLIVLWLLDRI